MMGEFDWLRALIDTSDQPVFAFDRELRYTAFNSAHADVMRALFGAEIALGGRLADYQTVKADRETAQANLERALAGERVVASAFSGEPGRERYFDIVHDPLTDAAGTVVGVVVHAYDVSETKMAEEEVSTILRTTIDGYYLVDMDGRFLDTNDSYCQMIGHSREALLQMSVRDIEAIDTQEDIEKRIQRIMETGHDRFETKHRRKDGRVIDIEASVNLLRGDQDKLVVFMRDITERKRADEALAEKTRLAQIFMDALPCVALLLDRSRTVILPNKAAVEAGALPGTQCFSTWGQRADSCPWCLAPAALESGEARHVVVEALGIVWDAHWIPVGPDLYLHYAFDITERKRSEEALRESEARLSDIIFSMADWMWEVDANGVYTYSSQKSYDYFGPSRGDVIGKTPFDLMPADEAERVAALFAEIAANKGPIVDLENWNLNAAGERFCVLTNGVPLVDDAGNLTGYRGVDKDITERKHAEEELLRHAEQLQRTVEGAVLAMSHMVESRDPYTAGHERRVAELATAIGAEQGMAGEELDALRLAGTIHDIGKVAVPAEILSKPGRLSVVEFELIKQHSQVGFDILADVDFGRAVAEMVLQHHERLDGSGYPRGLKGEDVMAEARILAVADVVEAMSSHRPYRAALGIEAALDEVRAGAGTRYEAAAVEACEKVFAEGFAFTES
jgi:PAS domain S-box-containing protein